MKLKTLLLAAAVWLACALPSLGCISGPPSFNNYIFRSAPAASADAYSRSISGDLMAEWSRYAHAALTADDLDWMAKMSLDDVATKRHPVLKYAHQQNDQPMLGYLRLLARYMEAVRGPGADDLWYYPSEEDLQQQKQSFRQLLAEVQQAPGRGRYAERYRLLEMRILFHLEDWARCRTLWTRSGIKHPTGVFDRMAYGLYAGALFHEGRRSDAAAIYARLGDTSSARLCLNSASNVACLRSVVMADPNSAVLPIMIDHFVSSIQETHDWLIPLDGSEPKPHTDAEDDDCDIFGSTDAGNDPFADWRNYVLESYYNTLARATSYCRYAVDFTRFSSDSELGSSAARDYFSELNVFKVYNQQITDFLGLAEAMLQRSDAKDAALWASARAYILYMCGRHAEAWQQIKDVGRLSASTQAVADNARTVRLLIATTLTDSAQMQAEVLPDLRWLVDRATDEEQRYRTDDDLAYADLVATPALQRILAHGLGAHYCRAGLKNAELLCYYLVSSAQESLYRDTPYRFYEEEGMFADVFMARPLDEQERFYTYLFETADKAPELERYLCSLARPDRNDFRDYIGTHCILEGQLEHAIVWLEQVPLAYLERQHIAPYAAQRSYLNEQWFASRPVKQADYWEKGRTTVMRNAKLDFCRDVLSARAALTPLTAEARCRRAYELATMLFQASYRGECWWLARYRNSVDFTNNYTPYWTDCDRSHDYIAEARRYLQEALRTTDPLLRSQALMADFYIAGQPPYTDITDYSADAPILVPNPALPSYDAFKELQALLKGSQPYDRRISRCDVLDYCLRLYAQSNP